MKRLIISLLLVAAAVVGASAQVKVGAITGKVVSRQGREAIEMATVTLKCEGLTDETLQTDQEGIFTFDNIPYGQVTLEITAAGFQFSTINVKVDREFKELNYITLAPDAMAVNDFLLDDGAFAEFDSDISNDSQSTPVSLSASKDVFNNIAGYKFGALRFRTRGYDQNTEIIYLNGVEMTDANSGNGTWSLWSGLNEATRNQEATYATSVGTSGVGGINGTTNILARASQMRQGFRTGFVTSSGSYRHRVMATYTSGMQDNGWAYAASISGRVGGNDFVEGVTYNAWAYFLSAEKRFNERHQLAFTFFGVPTQRGAQMAATQEAYSLADSYWYNPNVGMQNGKLRNARVRSYHEPVAMLNYFFNPTDKLRITAAASFRFGQNGYSALDWNSAADPRPDYYRNLPSYWYAKGDPGHQALLTQAWKENREKMMYIDFDKLYNVNYNSNAASGDRPTLNYEGTGLEESVQGQNRSRYIISERHTDQRDLRLKLQGEYTISQRQNIVGGVDFRRNRTEYYTSIKDLLGGDYWVNIDNFAERDIHASEERTKSLNDLNRSDNYIVREGDKYGYDYYAHSTVGKIWGAYNLRFGLYRLALAGEVSYTNFYREGLYRKGLFADDSFGESKHLNFFGYNLKGNYVYEPNGANSIQLSVVAQQNAPYFQDAFVSPRTRNTIAPGLDTEKVLSFDAAYNFKAPWMQLRASVYYTSIKDQSKLISFYDDVWAAFSNMSLSGIDSRYYGLELGLKVPITADLSFSAAASIGDYTYTSNPYFTQTRDNTAAILVENERVYWKGMKIESTPQTAINVGLNYRTSNNIYLSVDAEYFDNMYLSMNPLYRTLGAMGGRIDDKLIDRYFEGTVEDIINIAAFDGEAENIRALTAQEKFNPAIVVNASIGKTWYVGSNQFGFSLEIKNLTNTICRTGGFEQMRLFSDDEYETTTGTRYSRFDSKYFYLYGTNYYLNIYFRF
ncbi:MAG: carboxypeptidase-like regulatory domain-containing protein [Tidjanibacter sp.]|nr:carboxypeptidase-like regulatory domain-containing protein [Tidjanibacter sp.]